MLRHRVSNGKFTLRSFPSNRRDRGPLHMVSAWASSQRLVLGQQACEAKSNEITAIAVLAGHHQPLRMWVLCLYFMGLNLSNKGGSVRLLWREKRSGV